MDQKRERNKITAKRSIVVNVTVFEGHDPNIDGVVIRVRALTLPWKSPFPLGMNQRMKLERLF